MAVTKLLLSKKGYRAFYYLVRDKDDSETERVLAFDTIGIMHGSYEYIYNQFKAIWKRAGKQNWIDENGAVHAMDGGRAHNQAILTITSFSNEDFPRLPGGGYTQEQIHEALDIVRTTHEEMGYKQVFLVAQCDGDGGFLHVHGFVNAVDPVTYKSLVNNERNYKRFRAISDKVIQQFGLKPINPDKKNILSPEEREKRKKDGKIPKDQVLFIEVLKEKIYSVLNEGFTSREEFIEKLAAVGVKAEFRQEKNGKKGPEGIVYHMFDKYGKKHRDRKRKASNLGTDFMLQSVDMVIEETRMKSEIEANVFTEEDARKLRSWNETLEKTPAGGANDMTRNVMQRKIDELEAKRDKAQGITKEERETKTVSTKEESEPKKNETPVAEEIEERIATPSIRRKTEERKGRRPEDEVHEVPVVKPLRDFDPYYGYERGADVPWLERLEDEKEEQEEISEVAVELVLPEDPKMSEAQRRKDEKMSEATAKFLEILNSNDAFFQPGGLPDRKDDKSIEK